MNTLPTNIGNLRLSDLLKIQGVTVNINVNVTADAASPPVIMPPPPPTERMLRIEEIVDMIGMSKPWIYQAVKAKGFPAPKKSGRSSRWLESDIKAWMERNEE